MDGFRKPRILVPKGPNSGSERAKRILPDDGFLIGQNYSLDQEPVDKVPDRPIFGFLIGNQNTQAAPPARRRFQAGVWGVALDPPTRVFVYQKHISLLSLPTVLSACRMADRLALASITPPPAKLNRWQAVRGRACRYAAPMRLVRCVGALTSWGLTTQIGGVFAEGERVELSTENQPLGLIPDS